MRLITWALLTAFLVLFGLALGGALAHAENHEPSSTYLELQRHPDYTCFTEVWVHEGKHAWDRTRVKRSLPWVLIEHDATGLRLAQPSAWCEDNGLTAQKCPYYWDRTEEVNGPYPLFYNVGIEYVPCPPELRKGALEKKMRKD